MQIDILTLFPKMFRGPFAESIIKRAVDHKLVKLNLHNLRDFAIDKRGTVDDRPFGGGKGMLLRPEPIFNAVKTLKKQFSHLAIKPFSHKIVLLDPGGQLYNQQKARQYSRLNQLILICGHYEGVDYRVHQYLADEVISIGDYVLTGGEIPAMVIVDSLIRLIPGVLESEAISSESFSTKYQISNIKYQILEFPQYTRPQNFRGHKVPTILLSGNHQKIENWRQQQALKRTQKMRPDLLTPTI